MTWRWRPPASSASGHRPTRRRRAGTRGDRDRPAAWPATPGATCAATRSSGSPPSLVVLVIVLMAVVPGAVHLGRPDRLHARRQHAGPSGGAFFGYDFQGCDVYARTVYGARASIAGRRALAAARRRRSALVVGMLAGYFGGWVDAILSRVDRHRARHPAAARRDRADQAARRRPRGLRHRGRWSSCWASSAGPPRPGSCAPR